MREQYCPTHTNFTLANLLTRQGTSLQTKISSTKNTCASDNNKNHKTSQGCAGPKNNNNNNNNNNNE